MSFKQLLTVLCITILATSLFAQVPNTINYQGRLTDASGNPVADGAYLVNFIIYDAPTAGTDLWNTGFQTINTVDGLFSYQLGSMVALPNGIFSDTSRYLGLTVGTDPELSPRSRFISSAYAFEAGNVDWSNISNMPAGFADGVDDAGLSKLGDTLKGYLYFDGNNDGVNDGFIQVFSTSTNLSLGDNGQRKSFIYGSSFGEIDLYDSDGDKTALLYAGSNGGTLLLGNTTGANKIRMEGNTTGNSSVQFPSGAIDNTEILDEPGIAGQLNSAASVTLDQSNNTFVDLATVTITIPSSGYIYITGHTLHVGTGTSGGTNFGIYQIDETSGGSINPNYYTWAGFQISPNSSTYYSSVDVNRIYFKTAGTYTFRLEGSAYVSNNASATTRCFGSKIIAMYFPTSYGSVTTVSPQSPTGIEAALVQSTDLDGSTEQVYTYDLRDLELKAKEAQLKAQQAEMELLKARQLQNRQE